MRVEPVPALRRAVHAGHVLQRARADVGRAPHLDAPRRRGRRRGRGRLAVGASRPAERAADASSTEEEIAMWGESTAGRTVNARLRHPAPDGVEGQLPVAVSQHRARPRRSRQQRRVPAAARGGAAPGARAASRSTSRSSTARRRRPATMRVLRNGARRWIVNPGGETHASLLINSRHRRYDPCAPSSSPSPGTSTSSRSPTVRRASPAPARSGSPSRPRPSTRPTSGCAQRGGASDLPAPWVPGMDAAGVIESVGPDVDRLQRRRTR